MYELNASLLVKHSELGSKNLNKICLKIVQKVLKWPLHNVNFQNFSGGSCPRNPLSLFILNILQNNSQGKTTLEIYVEMWCPLPENVSGYAADMRTFFKGLIYAQLVNIQPNSKFHPLPPKFFGSAPTKIFWIRTKIQPNSKFHLLSPKFFGSAPGFYYHLCKILQLF